MECPKCKKPLTVASGIGPYCANENCPVLDDYRLWERKVLSRVPRLIASRFDPA